MTKPMELDFLVQNIVNQLFDLACVPAEKRYAINDRAENFVSGLLVEYFESQQTETEIV